ncbi:unnamed protein product, partial [Polarella glacialis]
MTLPLHVSDNVGRQSWSLDTTPLSSWLSNVKDKFTPTAKESKAKSQFFPDCEDDDKWDQERGFDIADSLENGMAREIVSEFMHP